MNLNIRTPTKTRKGFGLGDIGPVAISLGTAIIVVAVVAMILSNIGDNVTDGNATYVINKGLTAMASFADWFAIIVVVTVSVIILAIVLLLRDAAGGRQ